MRIGELAQRTGVSERSLRYYEERGLLVSDRTPSGQRTYGDEAVDRVVHIQELFAAGLHSTTIATLLPCMRDTDGGPADNATPLLVEKLVEQRRKLDATIRELTTSRAVLDDVISSASAEQRSP